MGSKISIDKHVSNLEDILEMNPAHFSKLKVDNSIPNTITQHIKIWRYYEDDRKSKALKSAPINLKDILSTDFNFVSNECYLVLFIYKKQADEAQPVITFPASILSVVESSNNLTARGLETPVASSESISSLNRGALESFLLPKTNDKTTDGKFEYMIFVWNGKTANPLMKALTLSAAVEFDSLISKAKDPFLHVLFSGGYVRNKKLWIGKILQLDSAVPKETTPDVSRKVESLKESISLLKFLFPGVESRIFKPSGFKDRFLKPRAEQLRNDDEYVLMGEGLEGMGEQEEEEEEEEEYIDGASLIDNESSVGRNEVEADAPKISSRKENGFSLDIPRFPFNNNVNMTGNAQSGGNLGSGRGDEKPKKFVPSLGLGGIGGLGNIQQQQQQQQPQKMGLDFQAMNGAQSSVSQEQEEEDPPMSSGRTSDSHDSRRISERRGIQQQQAPLMNLALRNLAPTQPVVSNYEELRQKYDGDQYDAKESDFVRVKKDFFAEQCSPVIDGFLYVAGETIANNEKKLMEYGITHVLNAAGDACENRFPERFQYLTYYLKDSKAENIECVFYEATEFIDNARQQGGKVLVHCVQGVSRSVALCIAYLIRKEKYTFSKAYEHIRNVRGIASPNAGFWAQLVNFQLRIYGPPENIPLPRVFCIGSFQKETPQTLVCRMLFEAANLYNPKSPKTLDPRGVFILHSRDSLKIWVGSEIHPANKDRYLARAESYLKYLQQNEGAPSEYEIIHHGEEPAEFWQLWETEPQNKYGRNKDWDHWFVDLASHKNVEGTTIYEEQEEDEEEPVVAPTSYVRPALFCFPRLDPFHAVEMDELMDDNLLILCVEEENERVAYLWRGNTVPPEIDERGYLGEVLAQRWPDVNLDDIRVEFETPDEESDDFINYFQ